ncbi:MAG: DUF1697 domain-containing protein [Candidatus Peregrinibacteria bacterium]|nr:DUF1697 domain-containing protein [Candidatus Peregrinibacteria bacterium]
MTKYVAFLRAINVGGNNIIKMDALRTEFEKMEFRSVKTYIQSGNVLFESDLSDKLEIEKKIEKALAEKFKYNARVLIRSQKDMENIVSSFPKIFSDTNWKHNVIFLSDLIDSKEILKTLETKGEEIEKTFYAKGVLFWSANMDTITGSNMLKLSTRKEYKEMTVRNLNTTRKILELMS